MLYPNVYLQVMGIRNVGEQGMVFDEETPERIIKLKQLFGDTLVQVDGGIVVETAKRVLEAGAENLVVGSYIFGGEDAGGAIERLSQVKVPDSVY
jgi:ribulose-phosphate 3-epimerase